MKKILIAEDSLQWQRVHRELLSQYDKEDIDFEIYDSAKEALGALKDKEKTFDLILTDLQMETDFHPEFAGEWLVSNIKTITNYKNAPIVIISAAFNISFIAERLGVKQLSKRVLVSNPESYFYMLDENL